MTYRQVGAQFAYGLAWTKLFSFPVMAAIQEVSARVGCVRPWRRVQAALAPALMLVSAVVLVGLGWGRFGTCFFSNPIFDARIAEIARSTLWI